jgi:hypothetical protein
MKRRGCILCEPLKELWSHDALFLDRLEAGCPEELFSLAFRRNDQKAAVQHRGLTLDERVRRKSFVLLPLGSRASTTTYLPRYTAASYL